MMMIDILIIPDTCLIQHVYVSASACMFTSSTASSDAPSSTSTRTVAACPRQLAHINAVLLNPNKGTYVCKKKKMYINTYEHICMNIYIKLDVAQLYIWICVCECVCVPAVCVAWDRLEGVCVCVRAYIYIHIYMNIYMMTSYIDINLLICTYKHRYKWIYIITYGTWIYIYTYIYIYICQYTSVTNTYTSVNTCIYTHIHKRHLCAQIH
jgi:hypothetical protein